MKRRAFNIYSKIIQDFSRNRTAITWCLRCCSPASDMNIKTYTKCF